MSCSIHNCEFAIIVVPHNPFIIISDYVMYFNIIYIYFFLIGTDIITVIHLSYIFYHNICNAYNYYSKILIL